MKVESGRPSSLEALVPLLTRTLVKAMRATLRSDGPMSGGSGARLFGQVLEEALSDAVARGLRDDGRPAPR